MKKLMLIATILPAFAFGQIAGTKHDFATNTNAQSGDSQICRYCHIPHGARAQSFIFSHTATTQTYTWGATTQHTRGGTTLQDNIATNGSWSAGCLDCHDGSVAVGQLTIGMQTFSGASIDASGKLQGLAKITKGGVNNLNGNHPVSVPYPGQNGSFRGQAAPTWTAGYIAEYITPTAGVVGGSIALAADYTAGAPVYGVECSTCHDPHGGATTFSYMLRDSHLGSQICLDCHIK